MSSSDVAHHVPPETPAPAALPSGGRNALRVVLVVIAAVAVLGTAVPLGVLAVELGNSRVVADTQALPLSLQSLAIDTGDGPAAVRITTDVDATGPRVELRMLTRRDGAHLAVTNDAAGSRVTVSGSASGCVQLRGGAEVKVVLPAGVVRGLSVLIKQQSGPVTTNADLDQLTVDTGGDIALGGAARRVDVKVRKGDISTSSPIAVTESFRAVSESGDISVQLRAAPRTTEAIADGDVTVGLPGPGPYRVRAQTEGSGREPTVRVRETTDIGAPAVTAQSKAGNVLITEMR